MDAPVNLSRRSFFRARSLVRHCLRPPWAQAEAVFLATCTRCDACIDVCPSRIVVRGDGGFPEVDFLRGEHECSFCRACVDACAPKALHDRSGGVAWQYVAAIGASCLARDGVVCRSCGDICQPGAIRFRPQVGQAARPEVDLSICTGCGACVAPCPSRAVRITAEHPEVLT
ncbi:MAG: ferredoxin-type protein NapF [Rhodocyclaceae bacterium]|nr:ferredoxin-type protein NapF [Rhodocyclaceae bacterium]